MAQRFKTPIKEPRIIQAPCTRTAGCDKPAKHRGACLGSKRKPNKRKRDNQQDDDENETVKTKLLEYDAATQELHISVTTVTHRFVTCKEAFSKGYVKDPILFANFINQQMKKEKNKVIDNEDNEDGDNEDDDDDDDNSDDDDDDEDDDDNEKSK